MEGLPRPPTRRSPRACPIPPRAGPEHADLLDLVGKMSRTFALSIPPLSEPTRREVTVAYLLFRIPVGVQWELPGRRGA
jgi:hypothetical protein